MSDSNNQVTRRKRGQAKPKAGVDHTAKLATPTLVEGASTEESVVARSLRDGGMTALPTELLFPVGSTPLVVDTEALQTVALALAAAPDAGLWFDANRDKIRAVVFVPMQAKVLRATPLLSVRPHADPGVVHPWPVAGHMSGLHMVVGGTGSGKSRWLSKQKIGVTVRWGEPSEMYDAGESTVGVADLAEMLAVSLALSAAGFDVAVDSFRNLVFGVDGAAGAGGVSVALYAALTSINNVCAQLGLLITAAMNPMSTDDKASLVYNNIAASVAGMTVIENGKIASQTARLVNGRTTTVGAAIQGSTDGALNVVTPRRTTVKQPDAVVDEPRIDTMLVDHDDDEQQPARKGGKINL